MEGRGKANEVRIPKPASLPRNPGAVASETIGSID